MQARARILFGEHQRAVWLRSDRLFAILLTLQWLAGIAIALVYSPTAWDGRTATIHPHVVAATLLGGVLAGLPIGLIVARPGAAITRHVVAVSQMLFSALLIHLTGGRIETHFHVFGSLAFLAFYRDWRVLLTATVVVAADHAARGFLWPESVYGVAYASIFRLFEHAFWVVFEDVVLVFGSIASLREMRAIAEQRAALEHAHAQLVAKEKLEREMQIASRIQTSVLPRDLHVAGLEIAASMVPATEVGGDYYEVVRTDDGCWMGIGDVSGHGLTAGLVMMMMQSAVSGVARFGGGNASPREVLTVVNDVLYDNVRNRISDDSHATLSLLRYRNDGTLTFAGAHEDILVLRANGVCDTIATPGPWVGACRNIARHAVDTTTQLGPGDVMLLYTDGVTEAMNAEGEQFGMDRLRAELGRVADQPASAIRDHLMATVQRWTAEQHDDVTLVVVRRNAELALAA